MKELIKKSKIRFTFDEVLKGEATKSEGTHPFAHSCCKENIS